MNLTLYAGDWSGVNTPYSYIISMYGIASNSVCDILFNPTSVKTVETLAIAKIAGYTQETGKITLYAWGEKPNIDLDATLVIRGCL